MFKDLRLVQQQRRIDELEGRWQQALNREATMRETLARAQGECTRLVEELREARKGLPESPVMLGFIRAPAMFTEDDQTLLHRAVDTWGAEAQLGMLGEEALELALAVRHYQRERDGAWSNLAEEVADVEIMLGQVLMIMRALGYDQFGEQVMTTREVKLKRLRERLGKA